MATRSMKLIHRHWHQQRTADVPLRLLSSTSSSDSATTKAAGAGRLLVLYRTLPPDDETSDDDDDDTDSDEDDDYEDSEVTPADATQSIHNPSSRDPLRPPSLDNNKTVRQQPQTRDSFLAVCLRTTATATTTAERARKCIGYTDDCIPHFGSRENTTCHFHQGAHEALRQQERRTPQVPFADRLCKAIRQMDAAGSFTASFNANVRLENDFQRTAHDAQKQHSSNGRRAPDRLQRYGVVISSFSLARYP